MQYYTTIEDKINQNVWRKQYSKKKISPSPAATQQGDKSSVDNNTVVINNESKDYTDNRVNEYTNTSQKRAQNSSLKDLYDEALFYLDQYSLKSKETSNSFANVKWNSTSQKTEKGETTPESAFEKIENQSINYADYKPKSMFNFMDNVQKNTFTDKKSADIMKLDVQKYKPEVFKTFADNKPENQGPSTEMKDTVKTIKDTFKPSFNKTSAFANNNFSGSYGPNRESVDTVKTAKDTKEYPFYAGPNAETARAGYLDNRGQNAVEKMIENGLPKADNSITITKDNVYYQSPQKVESTLTEVQNTVTMGISDQKRELEDLQFQQKHITASGSKEKAAAVEEQIADKKADIEKLQKIDRKLKIGLAFNYQFMENHAEKLSEMSVDDILKENEEFDYNLPYFSPAAQVARTVNKGVGKAKTAVNIVSDLKVNYKSSIDEFTIGDINNTNSNFKFSTPEVYNPRGYKERKITVDKSNIKNIDNIQYDVLKAIDGKTISETTYQSLKKLAGDDILLKRAGKNLGYAGVGLDIIDFAFIVDTDLKDDGKLGTDFSQEFFGTAANWAGDYVGGTMGAKAGAVIGTATLGPVGTVIGGALGAAFGAYVLSSAMEDIGRYVGENINESNYTIDQYHQRAK